MWYGVFQDDIVLNIIEQQKFRKKTQYFAA